MDQIDFLKFLWSPNPLFYLNKPFMI